jgi:hypothetical protein
MFSNANPHGLGTDFTADQVNTVSIVTGQVNTRGGLVKVVFAGQTDT